MSNCIFRNVALVLAMLVSTTQTGAIAKDSSAKASEGTDLIGTKAPEFIDLTWVNSQPLSIASLRGKLIFLRFWNPDCEGCKSSTPALNYLNKKYKDKGLVVLGIHKPTRIHHPNCNSKLVYKDQMKIAMNQVGAKFTVAVDTEWNTIKAYWTNKDRRDESASFLIDKSGIIRWVHPGGVILLPTLGGDAERVQFENLERKINSLL